MAVIFLTWPLIFYIGSCPKKKKKCFLNIHKKYHDTSGHNFKVLPITFRIEFKLLTLVLYDIWLTTNYPLRISLWHSLILEAPATPDFFHVFEILMSSRILYMLTSTFPLPGGHSLCFHSLPFSSHLSLPPPEHSTLD